MKLLILIFVTFLSTTLQAQTFTVSADKMSIAYIGIDNKLTIVADNCTCANLYATTDNGELIKKDSCRFIYRPAKMGSTSIHVEKRQNGKAVPIDTKTLRVKSIPDPHVMLGGKSGGIVAPSFFKGQKGITFDFDQSFELDLKWSIVSFQVIYLAKLGDPWVKEVQGNHFSSEVLYIFSRLKAGDRILFGNIRAEGPDGITRSFNSMSFYIR